MRWLAGLFIAALVGAVIWVVVAQHRWENRCHDAGGKVEQRFEGYITTFSYTYDAKGNITSVIPVIVQDYSYHCWVNGAEVSV
jgi:hypothetical protein